MSHGPVIPERAAETSAIEATESKAKTDLPPIRVHFYSYFKDLTGCGETVLELPSGATVADLISQLETRFPRLIPMRRSTLIAVGVDYQGPDYVLREGDEVSLFPPVQGG